MTDLFIEEVHHLDAAKGWIELSNHVEAFNELEKISPRHRALPEVLELRRQVYALAGRHDCALPVAEALVKEAPAWYPGHIWRSHSLHELGRTREAIDRLTPAAAIFAPLGIIPFHLACYHAALGQLHDAKVWLRCAFQSPEADALKLKALDDAKLKDLWEQIGKL